MNIMYQNTMNNLTQPVKSPHGRDSNYGLAGYYSDILIMDREFESFLSIIRNEKKDNNAVVIFARYAKQE